MASEFPQQVLSESLRNAIGSRTVVAGVFLTFRFEPAFFESEILPLLFDQVFSHVEKVRLTQLESLLPTVRLAVYYDRNGLDAAAGSARLDYRRIALGRTAGYFHPKNVILLLEEQQEEGEPVGSLLVMTLSANLTRAGWWENLEVAQIEEVAAGEKCPYRADLLELFARIRQEDRVDTEHEALEYLRWFVDHRLEQAVWQRMDGRLRPQYYVGRGRVPDFLRQWLPRGMYNLEVISPYHAEDTRALQDLLDAVEPRETRVRLPETADGSVGCTKGYYEAVAALPGVSWARLPVEIAGRTARAKGEKPRFVHAKVYRFWNRDTDLYLIGSANLTAAAFSTGRSGNFETAVLLEPDLGGRAGWFLEPVDDGWRPPAFAEPAEEGDAEPHLPALHLRYDWSTGALQYFWEDGESVPSSIDVSSGGVPKFSVAAPVAGRWVDLDVDAARAVKELLVATSLVDVSVDHGEPFPILVREEGMQGKPSLVRMLTVEEILLYWSLLSPEQKEHFLSLRIPLGDAALPLDRTRAGEAPDSMFSRFAGIYHAFGRLQAEVWEAIDNENPAVADYRLFGAKHDSLPTLLERVESEGTEDAVNRYVIALCAKQLVRRLRRDHETYAAARPRELKELAQRIERAEQVRDTFSFGTEEDRDKFLAWFERMFLMEMRPLSPGGAA